jgi:hypothetical protein
VLCHRTADHPGTSCCGLGMCGVSMCGNVRGQMVSAVWASHGIMWVTSGAEHSEPWKSKDRLCGRTGAWGPKGWVRWSEAIEECGLCVTYYGGVSTVSDYRSTIWNGMRAMGVIMLLLGTSSTPACDGTISAHAATPRALTREPSSAPVPSASLGYGLGSTPPVVAPADTDKGTVGPTSTSDVYTSHIPIVFTPALEGGCSQSSFGTMLIHGDADSWITPADVLIYAHNQLGVRGMAGTGAPSEQVRDEWFSKLPGWTRLFMRGSYAQLQPIHQTATMFGMADMYECFAYGPESAHQAGEEALDPSYWVPQAEDLAEAAGKCLAYAPAVQDYERMSTPESADQPDDDQLSALIAEVAPHVDIWVVQLGKYQPWVDGGHDDQGNPYTMDDFGAWIARWVSWIKTANPATKVWTQLGIGLRDPIQDVCLPPQPPEYILGFRETLIAAGVDGVWVMPAQPCQPCPPSPPPGFLCSTDPQDNEYYQQSLVTFREAIEMACGP